MRPSRLPLSTSVALVLALAPAAHADDDVSTYREAVARGSALFDDGDFAAARAEFESAYAIHPAPVLLFNIASTYRREGDAERAIALYRVFLERAPASDPRRPLATKTISDLEAELAERAAAAKAEEEAAAAKAEPEASYERDALAVEPAAPPAILEPPSAIEQPLVLTPRRPRAGAVLRGAGIGAVAAGVIGAGAALLAARDAGRAEEALSRIGEGDSWGLDEERWYERGQAAEQRVALWGATSAALVTTGVVLYVVGYRRDRDAAAMTVTPTSDGAVMSWSRAW